MTKMDTDGDGFQMLVGVEKVIHFDRSELDIVANEDGDTTSSTTLAIASEEGVSRERRVRVARAQFSFLKTRNFDVVFAQERRELILRSV